MCRHHIKMLYIFLMVVYTMVFDKSGCSSEPVKVMWCDVTACWMTKHWMMMVWTCMFYTVRTYCSLFDPPTHCKTVEYCFFHVQWNSVIARADGPGTFSRYSQMTNLPRETKGNNLRQRHRAHSSQTKMWGGRGGRGRGDYTPHKDAPFVVFLCYQPPRDVPYWELDDEVGVGRVARTFVTRNDRKSLVITEMIIH